MSRGAIETCLVQERGESDGGGGGKCVLGGRLRGHMCKNQVSKVGVGGLGWSCPGGLFNLSQGRGYG